MDDANKEIDKMSEIILSKLETATSEDLLSINYAKKIQILSDLNYTKKVLLEIQEASLKCRGDIEKKAVIKALLYSTWIYRLYFIIRSILMGLISVTITFGFVIFIGTVNFIELTVVELLSFLVALIVTRFFDVQIIWATKKIIERLANYEKIRDFIMNNF